MPARTPEDCDRLLAEYLAAGAFDDILALYEPQALFYTEDRQRLVGHAGIAEFFGAAASVRPRLRYNLVEVLRDGDDLAMLYNDFSVVMGLVYFLVPYMIINIYVSLDGIDRNLEASARTLGCSPWQTFREVTLPLSLPGLGAGCMLCFVLAAGSYVTPRLLGGPDTLFFPDLIYEAIISQLDWPTGSVLSVILLLSLGLLVAVYNRFMSLSDIYRSFAR